MAAPRPGPLPPSASTECRDRVLQTPQTPLLTPTALTARRQCPPVSVHRKRGVGVWTRRRRPPGHSPSLVLHSGRGRAPTSSRHSS